MRLSTIIASKVKSFERGHEKFLGFTPGKLV
jgi:hypothetical protein